MSDAEKNRYYAKASLMTAINTMAYIEKSYKLCRPLVSEYHWTMIGRGNTDTPSTTTEPQLMSTPGSSRMATANMRIVFVDAG